MGSFGPFILLYKFNLLSFKILEFADHLKIS